MSTGDEKVPAADVFYYSIPPRDPPGRCANGYQDNSFRRFSTTELDRAIFGSHIDYLYWSVVRRIALSVAVDVRSRASSRFSVQNLQNFKTAIQS